MEKDLKIKWFNFSSVKTTRKRSPHLVAVERESTVGNVGLFVCVCVCVCVCVYVTEGLDMENCKCICQKYVMDF